MSEAIAALFLRIAPGLVGADIQSAVNGPQTLHWVEPPHEVAIALQSLLALVSGGSPDAGALLPFDAAPLRFGLARLAIVADAQDRPVSFDAVMRIFHGDDRFAWSVVAGFLEISDLQLQLYSAVQGDEGPRLAVTGVAQVLGLPFAVSHDIVDGFRLRLMAQADANEVLAKVSGGQLQLPAAVAFKLAALELSYQPLLDERRFVLALAGDWPLLGEALVVRDVRLEQFSAHGRVLGRRLIGTLSIGDIPFTVTAEHSPAGWNFDARSRPGAPIPIGDLMRHVAASFSGADTAFPKALADLVFQDLSLTVNAGEAAVQLGGEAVLQIGATRVAITLSLTIHAQGSGVHSRALSATVVIGGETFSVAFDDQSSSAATADSSSSLVASYSHQGGPPPNLRDLAADLSADLALIVPSIGITQALFGYHRRQQGDQVSASFLLGIELDAGIDLSAPDVDLPVVSQLFAGGLSFGVDKIQVLLTSGTLAHDALEQLSALAHFRLPEGSLERACLSADLRLGTQTTTHMLSLPGAAKAPAADAAPASGQASEQAAAAATPQGSQADSAAAKPAAANAAATPAPGADDVTWVMVNKTIGPLHVDKIGLRYADGRIGLLVGASMTGAGLSVSLTGLGISSPLDGVHPRFELAGLGLSYQGGPAEIVGAFLKRPPKLAQDGLQVGPSYSGEAVVKAASFTLTALGSFAHIAGQPSVFVFAMLDKPIGGPSCFYVTGLAAGFGYNRSLKLPDAAGVAEFPLVKAVLADTTAGNPFAGSGNDVDQALAVLEPFIAPALGESWLAVGLRFTSYKVVQSFALLTLSMGTRVELNLLGLSTMTMPTALAKGEEPIGFGQLALAVKYSPDHGVFSAQAQLGSDSYVLSKACHLTGGFAYFLWFKDQADGARAGDFVISLGGYHPRYHKPVHYPDVAPIGFNWKIDDLTIKGSVYFAMTPAAVMAGGALDAVWESGGIRAWFQAQADFLLSWKPFHYEAAISISLGASFTIDLLFTSVTLSIHVGVSLTLAGPPFGGRATVDLSVISFTIPFGSAATAQPAISWAMFRSAFLPAISSTTATAAPAAAQVGMTVAPTAATLGGPNLPTAYAAIASLSTDTYCSARFANGLFKTLRPEPGAAVVADGPEWVVNAGAFELVAESIIPAKTAGLWIGTGARQVWVPLEKWLAYQGWLFAQPDLDTWLNEPALAADIPLGRFRDWQARQARQASITPSWTAVDVGPADLRAEHFESELWVTVHQLDAAGKALPDFHFLQHVAIEARLASVPRSMWSVDAAMRKPAADAIATLNTDAQGALVHNTLAGLSFAPHIVMHTTPLPIRIDRLQTTPEPANGSPSFWSVPVPPPADAIAAARADPAALRRALARHVAIDLPVEPAPSRSTA